MSHGVVVAGERPDRDAAERETPEETIHRLNGALMRHNAELDADRRRWRGVIEAILDEVWVADAAGRVSLVKRGHHPDHVERVVAKIARCFATGEPWEDTFPLRGKDGEYRWFLSRAIPIHDAAGEVVRWFGTNTDVTEQREADQRKDEFLAMLSHELRNPLAPIKNSLHLLEHAAPGSEAARRARAILDRQITHLTRIVDDLLDVNRISRGKIRVEHERIDLAAVVGSAVEDLGWTFARRSIALAGHLPPGPIWVIGDAARLAQVVGNLLHNAAKFTPEHGRVDVTLTVEGQRATLRVRDTGVGIPPDVLATIFEPFTQATQALDRSAGGLGIGLALVRGLVAEHGGDVAARSEGPGQGAEITVRIPLDVTAAGAAEPDREVARAPARRVLIIEDNLDAAESLKEALALEGHEVAVAFGGLEGIDEARRFAPEIVLCDIGLPGIDGYEVARRMRADAALRDVPLVALSGYALDRDQQKALASGFDHHLAKPPRLDVLDRLLVELPARRAA